jgi:diaminopimelate epimerase
MKNIEAYKMDGLGNDFIIFDRRKKSFSLTKDQIIKISKRDNVGCDQVIFINNDESNDAFLQFYNSDGGEIAACGNGTRCVADLLMKENKNTKISLKTKFGVLNSKINNKNLISVNMGKPNFEWDKIPLSQKIDNKNLNIKIKDINNKEVIGGFSLSIGNPHVIFFVEDLNKFDLSKIGPEIENHNYFPKKCNVTLACIKSEKHIKVKVWERGAGMTKACGTAACATAISGASLKLSNRCVDIEFSEGLLNIDWQDDGNVLMAGKVSKIKKIIINI